MADKDSVIAELYKHYGILKEAGDRAGEVCVALTLVGRNMNASLQHLESYEVFLKLVKSETIGVKQLAAQFIPRFFKYFPSVAETAINAHLDLCEDENNTVRWHLCVAEAAEFLQVRWHAIRGLPLLCTDTPEHSTVVANILCQLLATGRILGPA